MEIQIYRSNADLFVQLLGRIVLDECDKLKSHTIPLIDRTVSQIHLDLSRVDFIDSAGLGVLVGLKMTSNKNKARLILISPSKAVHEILYVSKLDSIFDIVTGNEAEGIRAGLAITPNLIRSIGREGDSARGPGLVPSAVPQSPIALPPASGGGAPPSSGAYPPARPPISQGSGAPPRPGQPGAPAYPPAFSPQPPSAPPSAFSFSSASPASPVTPSARDSGAARGHDESHAPSPQQEKIDQFCRDAVEFMRQGDYDRAAECYQKAVDLDPNYLPAHNNLAIVFEKKPAWHQKALEQWERVLDLSQRHGDQKHIERASKHLANLRRL